LAVYSGRLRPSRATEMSVEPDQEQYGHGDHDNAEYQ
jgi:hypothetical protein